MRTACEFLYTHGVSMYVCMDMYACVWFEMVDCLQGWSDSGGVGISVARLAYFRLDLAYLKSE